MTYKDNAIGLYTTAANWTNPDFDFIVGFAGESWYDPNPELKPIELKAAAEIKPFLAQYKFNADFYVRNQYPMDKSLWPPVEKDEPFQKFVRAITSRDVKGVIIEVMSEKDHFGKVVDPSWISFSAEIFMGRVQDWMSANKPGAKLFIATSNDFISRFSPNMNNWAFKYNSFIDQRVTELDSSFPKDTAKPNTISIRATWEMWRYFGNLVLANASVTALYTWLGFDAPEPEDPEDPADPEDPEDPEQPEDPEDPAPVSGDFVGRLEAAITAAAKAWLEFKSE